jgi:hypothetical protein
MSEEEFKSSVYPLIINSSSLTSNAFNNSFRYTFPQGSVKFKNSKVAVGNISMYYSWFNISAANSNNTFSFEWPTFAGSTTYNVTIPDGFYDVAGLNSYLQQYCISNGLYLVNASSDYVYYLELLANSNYYAIQFNSYPVPTALPVGWSNPGGITFPVVDSTPQLIVPDTNFRLLIGFNSGTYPAAFQATNYSKLSDFTPQITPIQSLVLACTLLSNKYSNPSTILYSFSPAGTSFGSIIQSQPSFPSWVDIADGSYSSFDIQFLDQNFNNVIINDTNIVVQLLIKN